MVQARSRQPDRRAAGAAADTGRCRSTLRVGWLHADTNRHRDGETKFTQLKGQFLIDRDGVVRWSEIECGKEGFSGLGKFPTHAELIEAARRAL